MSSLSKAVILVAALAELAFSNAPAAEQSAPSNGSTATETLQEVTVTAQRAKLAPRVRRFVNQIVTPENDGADGIARWQSPPVCPLVSGLARQDGEFILARLSEIARKAGVPLAGERCRPNLYVLVTSQPEDLLKAMEKRNRPFTFGYDITYYPPIETPPNIVGAFIKTPGAVRVWYNSTLKDPWGQPLAYCPINPFTGPTLCQPGTCVLCGRGVSAGSHVVLSAMTTFYRVFIIVDRAQQHGVTLGQLSAYIAMVGFARLKPGTHLGNAPTILKLFDGAPQASPPGLTDWDQSFLKSLYSTEPSAKGQSGQIARAMVRDITH